MQKQLQLDLKDRDYDSDDDIKRQMLTVDQRLCFVSQMDHANHKNL